jgi:hypothetical protein
VCSLPAGLYSPDRVVGDARLLLELPQGESMNVVGVVVGATESAAGVVSPEGRVLR